MDRRLIGYYNRELQHLRESGAEFAREFPKIAGRLGLEDFACADPYVERLLEGFAFLAARVQLKLDAEFPRFTQSLLEAVFPGYLSPTPSMAVVQLQPDPNEGTLAGGLPVPRGTAMQSVLGKGESTACEYRTAHEVRLWPLRVTEAKYYTRELASLGLPGGAPTAKAALRIRLETTAGLTFDNTKIDSLTFFLRGAGDTPMRLYEQIFAHGKGAVAMPATKPVVWAEVITHKGALRQVGFEDDQALLPYGPRSFQGYRLLHEYFTLPQRYLFFEVTGLAKAAGRCTGTGLDLVVLFAQPDLELENAVDASHVALFCTPAVNLFPKRTDRIPVTDRDSEFLVIPDRTRVRDFEVYQVQGVTGYGARSQEEQVFAPFYSARDLSPEGGGAYYTTYRVPRMATSREQRGNRRSSYDGSDVYLSLVDAKAAPYRPDLKQLAVDTLCTNRDLPLQVAAGRGTTDFTMDAAPIQSVRCVSGPPTAPHPSHAEGESAWRLISHLTLNYLSLADSNDHDGARAFRELLSLYGNAAEAYIRKQIEGVRSVATESDVQRVTTPRAITFARGLRVNVTMDDAAFEGSGVFLLGAVLERFFAKYVSINSFTRTVIRTPVRGEVMKWPARSGLRHIL